MKCVACASPIRAYMVTYPGYCYECGFLMDATDKKQAVSEAIERLELDKAVVASWRVHV